MKTYMVVIDTKNFALYNGGIAHWFAPLLAGWIANRPDIHFILLGPPFEMDFLPQLPNWKALKVTWPTWLPRALRHPWYDNVIFPNEVKRLRPDLVMSPYHDVRIPKSVQSVITVHDLCLEEMKSVYPGRVRAYYLTMLRHNLRHATHVMTVSQTSRDKLVDQYDVPQEHISVVYNSVPAGFGQPTDARIINDFKRSLSLGGRFLLYTGGSEFRKNTERLGHAFAKLVPTETNLTLLVTGQADQRWKSILDQLAPGTREQITFAGKLSDSDLSTAYAAADAVVYPSLCEGFGRVCLEAVVSGAPLTCSDLPVMREVAGNYANYFDPHDVASIAQGMATALTKSRRCEISDSRFSPANIQFGFMKKMDEMTGNVRNQI